jgi:PST family polysaccharide transporter
MVLPLDRLIVPLQDALFPAFSRWQDDRERLARVWLRVYRVVSVVVLPSMVGLAIVAPDFVHVVLGEKWHEATPVLQILTAVAVVQSLGLLGQRVLTALDRTRTIFYFTIVECALTIPAFAIGLRWGIVGVATCYSIVTIPLYLWYTKLTIGALGVTIRRLLGAIRGVLVATAVMGCVCLVVRILLVDADAAAWIRLVGVSAVGALVFAAVTYVAQPEVVGELRDLRRREASQ